MVLKVEFINCTFCGNFENTKDIHHDVTKYRVKAITVILEDDSLLPGIQFCDISDNDARNTGPSASLLTRGSDLQQLS